MDATNAERLAAGLPEWLPRGPETENAKLLRSVGDALDRIETDFREVQNAVHPQTASTLDQLEKLGSRMGVTHRSGESKESFRIRVVAAHQLLTTGGTADEIIGNMATILNISPESITVNESTEPGTFSFAVPVDSLTETAVSTDAIKEIAKDQIAAGYSPIVTESGTLRYIDEQTGSEGTYDPDAGYDGLVDGEPTGEGGTYGGLID